MYEYSIVPGLPCAGGILFKADNPKLANKHAVRPLALEYIFVLTNCGDVMKDLMMIKY